MCGIAGIIGHKSEDALAKMLGATTHRGPDDNGSYHDSLVSMGMNRLAVQDTSNAGHQPMFSENKRFVIVFNGEVYNFLEERKALERQGFKFRSGTDTEVVLKLFELYGKSCLLRLRGMFAFAIWDTQEETLFVARDHMGIKPFLYTHSSHRFLFCSEIKGLITSGLVDKSLDNDAVAEYFLMGHINQPKTVFENVKSLLPGHYLLWKKSDITIKKYWSITDHPLQEIPSYEDAVAQVRALTIASVKEEMISDVPLGVFLSGGLDSSVVTAAMKLSGASKIESFSVGFGREGGSIDESDQAKIAAIHFNTNHNQITLQGKEVAEEFENIIASYDQPTIDAFNTYFVSKYTKQKVTVALSGLGGDEFFGGYGFHKRFLNTYRNRKENWYYGLFDQGAKIFKGSEKLYNSFRSRALNKGLPHLYSKAYCNFFPPEYSRLIQSENRNNYAIGSKILTSTIDLDTPTLEDDFQRISLMNAKSFMTYRLLRDSDAVSMAHSLELRVPMINTRLAHFVFHLPWHYKLDVQANANGGNTYKHGKIKKLLADAFYDDLPKSLFEHNKKGFAMPLKSWLENDFNDRIQDVFLANTHPIFSKKELLKIYKNWQHDKNIYNKVWGIMVFDEWLNQIKKM